MSCAASDGESRGGLPDYPQRRPPTPAASGVRSWNCCCCLERLLPTDTAKDGYPTGARPFRIILSHAHAIFFFYTSWMESHNTGLIGPIWRRKTIVFFFPRSSTAFYFQFGGEQMGPWNCYCNAADHIRAMKQYIKNRLFMVISHLSLIH